MIAILWRYRVKPEHRAEFEAAYGPDGDWAHLFRRHPHYLGTELLCEPVLLRRQEPSPNKVSGEVLNYLTIDRWRSEADFTDFMTAHRPDYETLDAATAGWTEEEVRLGVWEDLADQSNLIGAK